MSRRALLLGSSYSSAPIFFSLKRRGLHVTVCGSIKDDPCHQFADQSCFLDYSDQEALLDFVRDQEFDFLVPSCNDFAYISGSYVAEAVGAFCGFDRHDTTLLLHTKHRFRKLCDEIGLPAPKVVFRGEAADVPLDASRIEFPVLVKPVDSFSGRGVARVECAQALAGAVNGAISESRAGGIVIEAFVNGGLHSHTAFVQDGAIFWDTFVDEFCSVYPYQVDCSYHPSTLSMTVQTGMREAMSKLVRAAHLTDGLLHTQFISEGDRFSVIECMRRGPGDLYGQLVERATGAAHYDMYTAKFLGERYQAPEADRGKLIGRHTISVDRSSLCAGGFGLNVPEAISVSYVPLKRSAERLSVAPFDKLGILFFEFGNAEDMVRTVPRIAGAIGLDRLEEIYGRG